MKKGSILRYFNNPYVSGILVGILFLFAASPYVSLTSKVDLVSGFQFIVTFAVPIWILLALFALILVLSKILAKYRRPAHLRYVRDEVRGVTLRWQWGRLANGKVSPVRIEPICPDCYCPLSMLANQVTGTCPECGRTFENAGWAHSREFQDIIVGRARRRFGMLR